MPPIREQKKMTARKRKKERRFWGIRKTVLSLSIPDDWTRQDRIRSPGCAARFGRTAAFVTFKANKYFVFNGMKKYMKIEGGVARLVWWLSQIFIVGWARTESRRLSRRHPGVSNLAVETNLAVRVDFRRIEIPFVPPLPDRS
jgi:hypothetical protein